MNRSQREELRRAIVRFQELTQPHSLMALIERTNELEDAEEKRKAQNTVDGLRTRVLPQQVGAQ